MEHATQKDTKKSFLTSLGVTFIKGATFSLGILLTGAVVVFAINYPSTSPAGETAGGKFMGYFNKMLVNPDLATTDGMVKNSDKVDGLHASEIGGGGLSAAGTSGGYNYVVTGGSCPSGWDDFGVSISGEVWVVFMRDASHDTATSYHMITQTDGTSGAGYPYYSKAGRLCGKGM